MRTTLRCVTLLREPQLLLESIDNRRVARQFRADHLQRHQPIQLAVLRLVDRAHAARAQHAQNFVAAASTVPGSSSDSLPLPAAGVRPARLEEAAAVPATTVAASERDAGTSVSSARRFPSELLTPVAVPNCVGISLAGGLGFSAMPVRT